MSKFTRFVPFLVLVVCVCQSSAAEQNVADLLARVRANQDLIKSGDWVVRTHHQIFGSNNRSYDVTFHIEFDGEKIRVQRDAAGRTTVYCSPYLKNTQSFFFATRPKFVMETPGLPDHWGIPEPITESLILYEREKFNRLRSTIGISVDTTIPSIRTMGFVTDDIFFQTRNFDNLAAYLERFEAKEYSGITVAQEEFKGVLCKVIRRSMNSPINHMSGARLTVVDEFGNRVTLSQEEANDFLRGHEVRLQSLDEIWLDPTKNYAIRRMVMQDSLLRSRMVLENDLKLDESSGVWYPAAWTFEEYRNDQLRVRETNTLTINSINKPIDPKRFTLESLGDLLKPGTPVTWRLDTPPPGRGRLEWDGTRVIAHGEFGEYLLPDERQTGRRLMIMVGVNGAIIAALFAARYYYVYMRDR